MPSCCARRKQVGDRDAGHPVDRIDPVQLQRLHDEVEAVGHLHCISLASARAHLAHRSDRGAGSNELGPAPSADGPPCRPAEDDNRGVAHKCGFAEFCSKSAARIPLQVVIAIGHTSRKPGQGAIGYHENAANLARLARPRRGMSMGVAQPVPLPNRPGYRTRANHDGNNFVPAVLEPQMTGSSAVVRAVRRISVVGNVRSGDPGLVIAGNPGMSARKSGNPGNVG